MQYWFGSALAHPASQWLLPSDLLKADGGGAATPTVKQPKEQTGAKVSTPTVSTPKASEVGSGGGGQSAMLGREMPGHTWVSREALGQHPDGGIKYKYRYSMQQGLGRQAKEGMEFNVGYQKDPKDAAANERNIVRVKGTSDKGVRFEQGGAEKQVSHEDWHKFMESHFGDDYTKAVDASVKKWGNAVYKHVPKETFDMLWDKPEGKTMSSQQVVQHLSDATYKVGKTTVGKKLQSTFKRIGVPDEHAVHHMVGYVLSRRNWDNSARASMIGAGAFGGAFEAARVARNYKSMALAAERGAGKGNKVTAAHVYAAVKKERYRNVSQWHAHKTESQYKRLEKFNAHRIASGLSPVKLKKDNAADKNEPDGMLELERHARGQRLWEARKKGDAVARGAFARMPQPHIDPAGFKSWLSEQDNVFRTGKRVPAADVSTHGGTEGFRRQFLNYVVDPKQREKKDKSSAVDPNLSPVAAHSQEMGHTPEQAAEHSRNVQSVQAFQAEQAAGRAARAQESKTTGAPVAPIGGGRPPAQDELGAAIRNMPEADRKAVLDYVTGATSHEERAARVQAVSTANPWIKPRVVHELLRQHQASGAQGASAPGAGTAAQQPASPEAEAVAPQQPAPTQSRMGPMQQAFAEAARMPASAAAPVPQEAAAVTPQPPAATPVASSPETPRVRSEAEWAAAGLPPPPAGRAPIPKMSQSAAPEPAVAEAPAATQSEEGLTPEMEAHDLTPTEEHVHGAEVELDNGNTAAAVDHALNAVAELSSGHAHPEHLEQVDATLDRVDTSELPPERAQEVEAAREQLDLLRRQAATDTPKDVAQALTQEAVQAALTGDMQHLHEIEHRVHTADADSPEAKAAEQILAAVQGAKEHVQDKTASSSEQPAPEKRGRGRPKKVRPEAAPATAGEAPPVAPAAAAAEAEAPAPPATATEEAPPVAPAELAQEKRGRGRPKKARPEVAPAAEQAAAPVEAAPVAAQAEEAPPVAAASETASAPKSGVRRIVGGRSAGVEAPAPTPAPAPVSAPEPEAPSAEAAPEPPAPASAPLQSRDPVADRAARRAALQSGESPEDLAKRKQIQLSQARLEQANKYLQNLHLRRLDASSEGTQAKLQLIADEVARLWALKGRKGAPGPAAVADLREDAERNVRDKLLQLPYGPEHSTVDYSSLKPAHKADEQMYSAMAREAMDFLQKQGVEPEKVYTHHLTPARQREEASAPAAAAAESGEAALLRRRQSAKDWVRHNNIIADRESVLSTDDVHDALSPQGQKWQAFSSRNADKLPEGTQSVLEALNGVLPERTVSPQKGQPYKAPDLSDPRMQAVRDALQQLPQEDREPALKGALRFVRLNVPNEQQQVALFGDALKGEPLLGAAPKASPEPGPVTTIKDRHGEMEAQFAAQEARRAQDQAERDSHPLGREVGGTVGYLKALVAQVPEKAESAQAVLDVVQRLSDAITAARDAGVNMEGLVKQPKAVLRDLPLMPHTSWSKHLEGLRSTAEAIEHVVQGARKKQPAPEPGPVAAEHATTEEAYEAGPAASASEESTKESLDDVLLPHAAWGAQERNANKYGTDLSKWPADARASLQEARGQRLPDTRPVSLKDYQRRDLGESLREKHPVLARKEHPDGSSTIFFEHSAFHVRPKADGDGYTVSPLYPVHDPHLKYQATTPENAEDVARIHYDIHHAYYEELRDQGHKDPHLGQWRMTEPRKSGSKWTYEEGMRTPSGEFHHIGRTRYFPTKAEALRAQAQHLTGFAESTQKFLAVKDEARRAGSTTTPPTTSVTEEPGPVTSAPEESGPVSPPSDHPVHRMSDEEKVTLLSRYSGTQEGADKVHGFSMGPADADFLKRHEGVLERAHDRVHVPSSDTTELSNRISVLRGKALRSRLTRKEDSELRDAEDQRRALYEAHTKAVDAKLREVAQGEHNQALDRIKGAGGVEALSPEHLNHAREAHRRLHLLGGGTAETRELGQKLDAEVQRRMASRAVSPPVAARPAGPSISGGSSAEEAAEIQQALAQEDRTEPLQDILLRIRNKYRNMSSGNTPAEEPGPMTAAPEAPAEHEQAIEAIQKDPEHKHLAPVLQEAAKESRDPEKLKEHVLALAQKSFLQARGDNNGHHAFADTAAQFLRAHGEKPQQALRKVRDAVSAVPPEVLKELPPAAQEHAKEAAAGMAQHWFEGARERGLHTVEHESGKLSPAAAEVLDKKPTNRVKSLLQHWLPRLGHSAKRGIASTLAALGILVGGAATAGAPDAEAVMQRRGVVADIEGLKAHPGFEDLRSREGLGDISKPAKDFAEVEAAQEPTQTQADMAPTSKKYAQGAKSDDWDLSREWELQNPEHPNVAEYHAGGHIWKDQERNVTNLRVDPYSVPLTGQPAADRAIQMSRDLQGKTFFGLGLHGAKRSGKIGYECSAAFARIQGTPTMTTDSIYHDAMKRTGNKHFVRVPHKDIQVGDGIVYSGFVGEDGKHHFGHVGTVVQAKEGNVRIVDSSASDNGLHVRKLHPTMAAPEGQHVIVVRAIKNMKKALDWDTLEEPALFAEV